MSDILTNLSEPPPACSIEASVWEQCRFYRRSPQVELHDEQDMLWYITGIPTPVFNAVVRSQLTCTDLDRRVHEVLLRFVFRRVPMMWFVGPSTQPADLATVLEDHGLEHATDMPGMAVDVFALDEEVPAPEGLIIRPVHDHEGLDQWVRTTAHGFGARPQVADATLRFERSLGIGPDLPWRRYLGLLEGKPVATSALFLGAGVAGIDNVTTVPSERRRGIGSALTLRPLNDARSLGYRVGVLLSTPMAVSMYRRLGFREYCTISQYVRTPDA
ncbi:MAG: GNAT family N-acetyltransferase [Chloroflexota bacterium]|nr:GNAT family N-acetyltransferase [Chloroflexota bacterium]